MLSQKRLNTMASCLFIVMASVGPVAAQDGATRPRRVTSPAGHSAAQPTEAGRGRPRQVTLEAGPIIEILEEVKPAQPEPYLGFNRYLLRSIQSLLGKPYSYGANGDGYGIDCSGFVWRAYRNAGLPFTRTSAADMFFKFPEAVGEEKLKFGTLVFFNNLTHVGIVKDANSFYHASRTHGVVLSPFKGYWEDRIDGYRVVELAAD